MKNEPLYNFNHFVFHLPDQILNRLRLQLKDLGSDGLRNTAFVRSIFDIFLVLDLSLDPNPVS